MVAAIFNQGVVDRVATFETRELSSGEAERAIIEELLLAAERDGQVVGWAKAGPYWDDHPYYDGVREATVYVERAARGTGVGTVLLESLAETARERGHHKLVGKVFTSNDPSIALLESLGWSRVGVHRRHGRLDGDWKDVLVVELLL